MISELRNRASAFQFTTRRVFQGVMAALLVFLAVTSFEYVGTKDNVVIQRVGAYNRTLNPGPRFKLPFPIETATEVDTKTVLQLPIHIDEESGEEARKDLEMLTKDMSKVSFEGVLQYNVQDPRAWLFNVKDPERVLQSLTLSVTRQVVAKYTFQESYSSKREEIGAEIKIKLQALLDNLDGNGTAMGVSVHSFNVLNPGPPSQLKDDFAQITQADSQKQTQITNASGEASKIINDAKGKASKIINEAEAEKASRVNEAKAEVAVFASLIEEEKKNPGVPFNEFRLQIWENAIWGVERVIDTRQGGSIIRQPNQ